MNTALKLSGAELDIAVALALGASKEKKAADNVLACGIPLHYRAPMFAVVNAIGIAVRWRPTADWAQGGPLLANLIENGYALIQMPGMPVTLMKDGLITSGDDVLECVARAVVEMFAKEPA